MEDRPKQRRLLQCCVPELMRCWCEEARRMHRHRLSAARGGKQRSGRYSGFACSSERQASGDELSEECAQQREERHARREWCLEDGDTEAESDSIRRKGVAAAKVVQGCVRTAAQMLKGQRMLVPCEATAQAQDAMLVTERSANETDEFEKALKDAHAAGQGQKVIITERQVRSRVDLLRGGAQPGASKQRNDALQAMAESPRGIKVLIRWCQCWADGRVSPAVVTIVSEQVLRPLRKDNGKPRNISLMEVLLKLASGVVQDAVRVSGGEGLAWHQYGGQPAGPELMLMVGAGMMNMRPDLAFVSLDGENAYGRMKRATMLRGTAKWCPKHARFLACLWQSESRAWLENGPGEWREIGIVEGTAQGDTSSTPAFSRGYRIALEEACEELANEDIWVHVPSLIDDLMLVTEPSNVERSVKAIKCALGRAGMLLNLEKSAAYIPDRSVQGLGPHPAIESIPQVVGGLPALGAAYGGAYEAVLGPYAVAVEPAKKRLDTAKKLAAECAAFATEGHTSATRHAAWCVLQKVAARALAYDLRTLEPSQAKPLAEELDRAVQRAARKLAGTEAGHWTSEVVSQAQWPTNLGGMGLGSAAVAAKIGRVAALAQCLPTARAHLRNIFPDASEDDILSAVPLQGALEALRELKEEHGIEIAADGTLATGREPRLNLEKPFQPIRGLTGKIVQELFRKQREATLRGHAEGHQSRIADAVSQAAIDPAESARSSGVAQAHLRHSIRLRSVAGHGGGAWVDHCPSRDTLRLKDREFSLALRWRLGLPLTSVCPCQLRKIAEMHQYRTTEDATGPCGKTVDQFGDHTILCGRGPGRYRVHNAIARHVGRIAREAGVEAEAEVVCPELLKGEPGTEQAVEARLDLHLWAGGPLPYEAWVDVTHTHPWRRQMRQKTAAHDGAAAEEAEERKHKRYGDGRAGMRAQPAAVEAWGRFGPGMAKLLEDLGARWAEKARAGPSALAATMRRWSAELGIAQMRAFSATLAQATLQDASGKAREDTDSEGETDNGVEA